MARKIRTGRQLTGLYHAREARHMSRSELVRLSGVSKQQLSRLEGGQIRMRLDHLKPFAKHRGQIPELDTRAGLGGGGVPAREVRKEGRHADPLKAEGWVFPASFVREQLHSAPSQLLVLDTNGDSMAPTILSGERVVVDTGHKMPTPDGLYAIRDTFGSIVVKRLQVMRTAKPTKVKIISDNPNHNNEETPLADLEIVGKVLSCLKLF
jgi:transcriptional regulator with XRE-family HTH domain